MGIRRLFTIAQLLLAVVPCVLTLHAQSKAADTDKQSGFAEQEQVFAGARREVSIAPTAPERFPDGWYPRTSVLPEVARPLNGKPYRAQLITNSDGVTYSQKPPLSGTVELTMRDSAGRERTESVSGAVGVGETMYPVKDVRVSDPVAHCTFHWSESVPAEVMAEYSEKVAFVTCAPKQVIFVDLDLYGLAYTHPSSNATILHGQVNGEQYTGLRYLNKTADENRPGLTGRETWYSTDLRLELASFELEGDPERGGKRLQTLAITSLERVEQDLSLFYPPHGFRVEMQPDHK